MHRNRLVETGKRGSRMHMYIGLGWKNQTSKCMHRFMLSNSSTELAHESATNISKLECCVIMYICCSYSMKIQDSR